MRGARWRRGSHTAGLAGARVAAEGRGLAGLQPCLARPLSPGPRAAAGCAGPRGRGRGPRARVRGPCPQARAELRGGAGGERAGAGQRGGCECPARPDPGTQPPPRSRSPAAPPRACSCSRPSRAARGRGPEAAPGAGHCGQRVAGRAARGGAGGEAPAPYSPGGQRGIAHTLLGAPVYCTSPGAAGVRARRRLGPEARARRPGPSTWPPRVARGRPWQLAGRGSWLGGCRELRWRPPLQLQRRLRLGLQPALELLPRADARAQGAGHCDRQGPAWASAGAGHPGSGVGRRGRRDPPRPLAAVLRCVSRLHEVQSPGPHGRRDRLKLRQFSRLRFSMPRRRPCCARVAEGSTECVCVCVFFN
mmetsp:Transcript_78437/g.237932  ORF Transcript_78437/g.237932 Transcript_78437/m.237932 type:complete len:362 (-) Transcript_78437:13-1098(-)